MALYLVQARLETEDEIEANSPEEAFIIASDDAMAGGDWWYHVELIENED